MLKTQAGIDMQHIPYKSAAASVQDVVGGRVPVSFQSMPSALAFVKSGKLRVLGVANEKRVPRCPTCRRSAKRCPATARRPGTGCSPRPGRRRRSIVKLHDATIKTLASKDVQDKLVAQGCEALTTTPEQFAAVIRNEMPQWQKIVKQSGAAVD